MKIGLIILTFELRTSAAPRSGFLTEQRRKEIREASTTKAIGKIVIARITLGILLTVLLLLLPGISMPGLLKLIGMLPVFAVLIVFLAFLRIAQNLVGFVDLLKFFIGLCIVRIEVGLVFPGQFPMLFSVRPERYNSR